MDTSLAAAGLVGGVVGILGGIIGTYCSIHNTKTPAEWRSMVRASICTWLALSAFLAVLFLLPSPWRWLVWVPYGIALPLGIRYINQRQSAIRESNRNV